MIVLLLNYVDNLNVLAVQLYDHRSIVPMQHLAIPVDSAVASPNPCIHSVGDEKSIKNMKWVKGHYDKECLLLLSWCCACIEIVETRIWVGTGIDGIKTEEKKNGYKEKHMLPLPPIWLCVCEMMIRVSIFLHAIIYISMNKANLPSRLNKFHSNDNDRHF